MYRLPPAMARATVLALTFALTLVAPGAPGRVQAAAPTVGALPFPPGPSGSAFDTVTAAALSPGATTYYDQMTPTANVEFSVGQPGGLADDFTVPTSQTWSINEVEVSGDDLWQTGPGCPASTTFVVRFYDEVDGLPGGSPVSESNVSSYICTPVGPLNDYVLYLAAPAVLTSGAYWLSVQTSVGAFSWQGHYPPSNRTPAMSNDGATWRTAQLAADLTFALGNVSPPPLQLTGGYTITGPEGTVLAGTIAHLSFTSGTQDVYDPSDFAATVDWGDGSGTSDTSGSDVTIGNCDSTGCDITGRHQYRSAGRYTITITGGFGTTAPLPTSPVSSDADQSTLSTTSTAIVTLPPSIITQPTNQTVCAGQQVSFSAAADGRLEPTVQWQVSTNGGATWSDIPRATSTTLTFTATAGENGNRYRAVFSSTDGSATTDSATLTVNTPPSVTTAPGSQTVNSGDTVTFTAAASSPLSTTVRWQVSTNGGASWSNIPDATSTTLTFSADPSQNGNRYRAVFTNRCGSTPTAAATLTVTAPRLTLTKTADAATVTAGRTIGFTLTVMNTGNGAAYSTTVSDPLPGGPGIEWSISGNTEETPCSISGDAGSQLLTCSFGSVSQGGQRQVQVTSATSIASCGTYANAASAGASNFATVTARASLTVRCPTRTTVTPPSRTVHAGVAVSYTATVRTNPAGGPTPTGTVQWSIDGMATGSPVALVGGQATFTSSSIAPGVHTVTARYAGATAFLPSSGSARLVVQASTSTTFTGPTTIAITTPLTVSASVTSTPASSCTNTGTVSFSLNRNPITNVAGGYALGTGPVSGGAAQVAGIDTTDWWPGTYTIALAYSGPVYCLPSSSSASLVVTVPSTTPVNTEQRTIVANTTDTAAGYRVGISIRQSPSGVFVGGVGSYVSPAFSLLGCYNASPAHTTAPYPDSCYLAITSATSTACNAAGATEVLYGLYYPPGSGMAYPFRITVAADVAGSGTGTVRLDAIAPDGSVYRGPALAVEASIGC